MPPTYNAVFPPGVRQADRYVSDFASDIGSELAAGASPSRNTSVASNLGGVSGGGEEQRAAVLRKLLAGGLVFTGVAAAREQPRLEMVSLIEDLDEAGIRFVHFSPRDQKRTAVLAEKMGLETDWNTAISLKPPTTLQQKARVLH